MPGENWGLPKREGSRVELKQINSALETATGRRMERRRLLHAGGKLRSRQRVLEGGSEEVFSLQRCQGQGEERKAVQGRCHLLSVLMDACCQEQESRLLAARDLLQEPLKRRKTNPACCKKRRSTLQPGIARSDCPNGVSEGESQGLKRGPDTLTGGGRMGDIAECLLGGWETTISV